MSTGTGGTHTDVVPHFPIGDKVASADFPHLDSLVGTEIDALYNGVQVKARLVRLDLAAGLTTPARLAFKQTAFAPHGSATYDVLPITATSSVINCVAPTGQVALVDNDLFWGLCGGEVEYQASDDATAFGLGEFVVSDGDAGTDNGRVKRSATNPVDGTGGGRVLEATAGATGGAVKVMIIGVLGRN